MNKKTFLTVLIVVLLVGLVVAIFWVFNLTGKKGPVANMPIQQAEKIVPSTTFKQYQDPSGFTFSYPDNLSITNNEIEDNSTYADLQLFAKGVNGSLNLKITDSKYKTIDDWLKQNNSAAKEATKEAKLGNLKAIEIQTPDRLLLGALDKGVFFDIEVPAVEKDFWMKVYEKMLTSFTFAPPEAAGSQGSTSTSDVSFEGEEVVE